MKPSRLVQQARTLWTLYTSRTPVYVILYLTSRCNFRCPMCFYLNEIKDPDKEEISLPELQKLSRSLGRMVQLSLTGGEPFLRDDIPEVVDIFAAGNSVQYVTIPTNGSLTDRVATTVERLVTTHPEINFRIPVSLDGFPEDHDRIRGAKSFVKIEATLNALYDIRRRVDNLVLDINTCYSSINQGRLAGLAEFVAQHFDVDNHTVTYVRGNADEATKHAAVQEYTELVADIRRLRARRESRPFSALLRAVMDYQRDIIRWTLEHDRMYVPCVAGSKMVVISEKGEVRACEILNRKLGNLKDHDHDLRALLRTPPAARFVKWIRDSKCHCTFECALATSIIYHKASYPRIVWRAIRSRLKPGKATSRMPESTSTKHGQASCPWHPNKEHERTGATGGWSASVQAGQVSSDEHGEESPEEVADSVAS